MNISLVGDSALLLEVEDFRAAQHLREAINRQSLIGIRELVPGYNTLLIEFYPLQMDVAKFIRRLTKFTREPPLPARMRERDMNVHYHGEDLEEVARMTGLQVTEVIRRHSAATYTVAFLGFAPGFPYLAGLDPALHVPRLKVPRVRVSAGAVAIADGFSGIYPQATPGGWRVLGHTDAVLFDTSKPSPTLFVPGDIVHFRQVP